MYLLIFWKKIIVFHIYFFHIFYRENETSFQEMDLLFAARGLLSFIAFTEFTASLRCLLPYEVSEGEDQDQSSPKSFIQARLFNKVHLNFEAERVLRHTYGLFCAICGVIILYAAVYAHYKPLANLASVTIGLKLFFILAETFIFASIGVGQNLIFPLVTGAVGLLVTLSLPYIVDGFSVFGDFDDDENNDLVKQARRLRKSKKS